MAIKNVSQPNLKAREKAEARPRINQLPKRPIGVYLEGELLKSPAFDDLNRTEVKVLLRFYQKRQISGKKDNRGHRSKEVLNNGKIEFYYQEAQEMRVSPAMFARALDGLIEHGFIDVTRTGKGMYKTEEPVRDQHPVGAVGYRPI